MKFISNISEEKYNNFVISNNKSHFLQSYEWGIFCEKEKKLISHFVGLEDEKENLVCASLLLERKLPLGFSYFYAPRGFVMDMFNKTLLEEFSLKLKEYLKNKKAIFLKVDPDIIIKSINHQGIENDILPNGMDVYNNLISLGYKHKGFTKLFETSEPRYTFRIDMNKKYEEIEQNFSKTVHQRIKRAIDLQTTSFIGDKSNIKDFYELMVITEKRKSIINHDLKYYETLYDIFHDKNMCNLFLGKVNIDNTINIFNINLTEVNESLKNFDNYEELSKTQKNKKEELIRRKEKLENDIKEYTEYKKEYGNEIITSAHFIVNYGDKAWVLYAGNHDILSEVGCNYLVYKDHIKYYYDKGIKIYDQFGTVGDLTNKSLLGLHEFKKKFGGDYVEFVGEFDYIYNKFMYFVYVKLIPIYRKLVKKITVIKRKGNE